MKIVFLDVKTVGDVPNLHLFEQFGEVAYYQTNFAGQLAGAHCRSRYCDNQQSCVG